MSTVTHLYASLSSARLDARNVSLEMRLEMRSRLNASQIMNASRRISNATNRNLDAFRAKEYLHG